MRALQGARRPSWFQKHWFATALISFLTITAVLVHLYLHAFVIRYVNQKLNAMPDYRAHLEDIGIHLWRCAYSIEGLKVIKRRGSEEIPFFKAQTIDISMQWKELIHRRIVAKIILYEPQINFISSENKAIEQNSVDKRWQDQVKALIPFNLNYVKVRDGSIHWRDPESNPPMNIYIQDLMLDVYNITNSEKLSSNFETTLKGQATVMKKGQLFLNATANPYETLPTFKSKIVLEKLPLPELNTFFKKYAALEVKDGTFNFYSELAGSKGELNGYAKPIINDLDTVRLKPEDKSMGDVVKGSFVEIVISLLTNRDKDRLGTRLEISGRYDQPGVSTWVAITTAFHNAFVQALPAKLDDALHLSDRNKSEIKNVNSKKKD